MKISCSNVSFYDFVHTRQFWEGNLVFSITTGQWHHITICLLRVSPIQSYTITVWYAFLSFFTHYPHKVMDEYRRCRHRSIKFQTLTGVMKPAFWQEQVFLLYHFSLPLQSSILSIIRIKIKKELAKTVAHYILHTDFFEFLWPCWTTHINIEILELWIFYMALLVISVCYFYLFY